MKIPKKILMATGGSALLLASSMITHFEGLRLKPYFDGGGILSVCYGHTGNDIERNRTYTQKDCDKWLDDDLRVVKRYVDPLVKVNINTLTQAALYSFAYNVGVGNFAKSTLLKKLNADDRKGACDEMKRWVYVKGEVWKGLMTRREIESVICYGDITHLS
ncbi:lysozyme (plasmid) [Arsenophonus nasoniae]|uniref:Lysozyme n=1 Tax=Arsenophonus nasoniae TaxID=638 RepID=A0A4V1BXT5_9GAMM|nr:lysozyme [Arsenophonus nasoniae]QBY46813.1 Lysozyme RrrD [Arsenophonus nasoniae]WGM08896.1 lysozyme [Arsenophonus nasoniae]WGM13918.1 lysozyme [Arsenophonus nasoniae]WGM18213.1 lysozyme [Arsenophonus nasoniae]